MTQQEVQVQKSRALALTEPYPHLQWQRSVHMFKPQTPAPITKLMVKVSLLEDSHKELTGTRLREARVWAPDNVSIEATADTGCQTCTAGKDVITALGCTPDHLVRTRHRIVGITDTSLKVLGALMLSIEFKGRTTRQMVHISTNIDGLYLSESALKDLTIIHHKFPDIANKTIPAATPRATQAQSTSVKNGNDHINKCSCPQRAQPPPRPDMLPFSATEENLPLLKEWLMLAFSASAFNTCTQQTLQHMAGAPVAVKFKDGAVPHAVHTPIPIPHHWKTKVKDDLDRDVRLGIIEKVPQGTPTNWCARMVVAPKKDGSPRRTVDLQQLNKATLRETHHTPSPFNLASSVPCNTVKTVLDAWNGYHSLRLSNSAKEATTFITEWGRYRYKRAPMGFHASGDAYTRRFDDIASNVPRSVRCIDDTLLWDDNIADAFWHAFDFISLCAENGIVFNKDKFVFAHPTVEFAGFEITKVGYRPPPRVLAAIEKFPTPMNITDIRSWFGLVNQVAYAFAQARVMQPFRDLLASKSKGIFFWDSTMDTLFLQSKKEIVKQVQKGVRTFQRSLVTCLATDWSKSGVGFTLTQKHCNCTGQATPNCGQGHWQLILAGSRFTSEAESRYAPIEGEALAVVHGLQSCRMFILGCPSFVIAVDHKPLIKILNDRALETIPNPRLLNLKEKTLLYRFDIIHIPGKSNAAPDATSRYPVITDPDSYTTTAAIQSEAIQKSSIAFATQTVEAIPHVSWQEVNVESAVDAECIGLVLHILEGFPATRQHLPESLRYYWPMREELYIIDNVPFKNRKMLIPKRLRQRILEGLHSGHQGTTGMLSFAKERFFWPGLDAAVRQTRAQCRQCNINAPSQHQEPLLRSPNPETPFQQTVMDLCDIEGNVFLVYADRYTGWVEGTSLKCSSFRTIRPHLLNWFSTFGVPEEIATDGGPPFNSHEFDAFLRKWNIDRRLSSAHYPQSNGRAEAAVKSIKRILTGNISKTTGQVDTDEAARAIMGHRNTPNQETGLSPAVALYGYAIRDHLPNHFRKVRMEWEEIADMREQALAKRHIRPMADAVRTLSPLQNGDSVSIQNQSGNRPQKWNNTGVIADVLPHRQYRVVVDGSRRATLRNRRFLRRIEPICRLPKRVVGPPAANNDDGKNSHGKPKEVHPRTPSQMPAVQRGSPERSLPLLGARLQNSLPPDIATLPTVLPVQHRISEQMVPLPMSQLQDASPPEMNTAVERETGHQGEPVEEGVTNAVVPRRSSRHRRAPERLDL